MKLMVMWTSKEPEIQVLTKALQDAGHDIVYWVGLHGGEEFCPPGAVFHDHFDAWDGKSAASMRGAEVPPSADLIEKMYRTESLVLTMMNKHYDAAPVDERKHMYYRMLGYWNEVLERTQAEGIVFNNLPHSVYNYVAHDLALMRGLRVVSFEDTWVALRLLPFDNFWEGSHALHAALLAQKGKKVRLEDLGPELRAYYEEHTRKNPGAVPSYLTNQRSVAEGIGLLRHRLEIAMRALRDGSFFRLVYQYLSRLRQENLRDEYARFEMDPDLTVPFVYFPLSFQPERTTSPQGDMYHDQILAAETLSAALPADWFIYIKEHPSQWWLRGKERYSSARYRGYYRRLAAIPNVKLVSPKKNSFTLLSHAKTVATITGTAGWEALLAGKIPLVFGYPWYRDCPGAHSVRSVEDCRLAFAAISGGASVSEDSIIGYLKALEDSTLRAHFGDPPIGSPKVAPLENIRTIATYVCDVLRRPK